MDNFQLLPLLIAVPLGAAFIIPLAGRLRDEAAEAIALLVGVALVVFAAATIAAPASVYRMGKWPPPFGIVIVGDALSSLMLLLIAVLSLCVIIYALGYMKRFTARPKFYTLLMLMITGMNGVVLTGDIFNLYVFLEIAAISSYALVAFGTEDQELEAAFKYLVLSGVASSFILLGIALLYSKTGTLNMAHLAKLISGAPADRVVQFVMALFIAGFGLKAAMVPFHAWLPDAHPSAPAPISAMLSGLLIKALGVYAIIRIFNGIFTVSGTLSTILITMGLLSMVVGVLLAVGQWDFKRLLAYHSISQMGYVVLGIGLGTPLGLAGAIFHMVNHGVFKSLLFLCSGSVERSTGTRNLKELGGLWHRMPVTSTTCSIASLSISGVPPFNGFWSKLLIIVAAVQAASTLGNVAYVIAGITIFVSFMTLVSFVKVQKYVIFGKLPEKLAAVKEAPVRMCVSLVVLAALCVGLGVFSQVALRKLVVPARDAALDKTAYIERVLPESESQTVMLGKQ
ncbi:MAG TPA: proton-conducting transporter membrane subunit [Planctomycetota bacterium]|nr:proton-conducting transporter membrane subunit [Planctomycetota bacterium]